MKTTFALAACAALSLAVAACGDDDDDASDSTTALTTPAVADTGAAPDTATGDTAAGPTEADDAAASEPEGTSEADPDLVADCEAFLALPTPEAEPPQVGEEVSDEFKDAAQDVIDEFGELDLNTDAANDARDAFVSYLESARDADEWTEELDSAEVPEEWISFTETCVSAGVAG